MGAGEGFGGRKMGWDFLSLSEETSEEVALLFCGSRGEAVVADPHEAFG